MSNAKRRHRRRYRKMRCIVLFMPGKSPPQKIGDPIPREVRQYLANHHPVLDFFRF